MTPCCLLSFRNKNETETGLKNISALIDIIKPVDKVEEGEGAGEYYPRPSVDGVHVSEVWDFDFELRRSSP